MSLEFDTDKTPNQNVASSIYSPSAVLRKEALIIWTHSMLWMVRSMALLFPH